VETIKMTPYKIAIVAVLLPLLTVHTTLTISILFGNLEYCLPYWSQCHSISATGRQYPEFFVFKALMIPTAIFMLAYWLILRVWLKQISNGRIGTRLITGLGVIASCALIIYTVTLGAVGEPYALARRIGVIFYFAFSSFGHLLLLRKLQLVDCKALCIEGEQKALVYICAALVISGILSAIAGFYWEGWDNWENAYEWWFSLFMISLFYLVARMWNTTGFQITFHLARD
jgi:hypothetical protein